MGIIPGIPLFSHLEELTEAEIAEQKEIEVIRDDEDRDFEEKLAKATKSAKEGSNVDIPIYLQNTNSL